MEAETRSGRGRVVFERAGARTVLAAVRAESPLRLLTPRNHGRAAWVIAASFGGGLVDGDAVRIEVDVGRGAAGLLGTQASTKVYRCPTATSRQEMRARVGDGGLLVSIPDPVACFAGARYAQIVDVALAPAASLVLIDAFTAGRTARGERWDFLRYAARTTVTRAGAPLFEDAIVLDPAHGDLRPRMGRFEAFATIALFGPEAAALRDAALEASPLPRRGAALVQSASPIGADGAVVRVAGASAEAVTIAVRAQLAGLAELLGDDPFARKW
jgi:urease accessory protein